MRQIIFYILCLAFFITSSCKHEEIPTYSGDSYLQFEGVTKADQLFSFVYSGSKAVRDTIYFKVRIAGPTKDYDRKVILKQVPEYHFIGVPDPDTGIIDSVLVERGDKAIAGVHYIAFDDPSVANLMVVKGGESRANIGVILLRDPTLKEKNVRLNFEIQRSDDFLVGDILYYKTVVEIADKLSIPFGWSGFEDYNDFSIKWNKYGPVKHQFMIDVSQNGERWDDDFFKNVINKNEGLAYIYLNLFKKELIKVNQERQSRGEKPLMEDEDNPNSVIKFV